MTKSWVVWLTGPPGSGKSTVAKELLKILKQKNVYLLELDRLRKLIVPKPTYTESERDIVYNSVVFVSKVLADNGVNVIIDATGHRRKWRDKARTHIAKYVEIYLKCDIELCMERECARKSEFVMKNIYEQALQRLRKGVKIEGLGEVIGVDVPYEEPDNPDLIIDTRTTTPETSAQLIYDKLKSLNFV